MYLFIWPDRRIRQVHDNLTVADHLAVKQGLLTVIRFDTVKNVYQKLTHDNERVYWMPLLEVDTAITADGKVHY